jgi:flagellar hook-associated protein 1 FlgK
VGVFVGGDFLVFEAERREVIAASSSDRGLTIAEIQLEDTKSTLATDGGEVGGLMAARDTIVGGFLDKLDRFAGTLAFEFNKIFAGGQGLSGFDELTSERSVESADSPLDAAGLAFTPQSGAVEVLVHNDTTGLTQTNTILVDLDAPSDGTSLADLAAELDSIEGISASITSAGALHIRSDSPNSHFAFAHDTGGVLAALGINTFFSGTTALDLGISQQIAADPAKFAASQGGIGEDIDNALELVAFLDKPLQANNGASILDLHNTLTQEITQGSVAAQSVAEGSRVFEETLVGQRMAISGVSLDDEAVRMITLQRAYQASARYIRTLAELLEVLVNL